MPLKTMHDEQPSLNLTSMIDVVMILVIFFLVASEFKDMENSIDLQVPRVAANRALSAAPDRKVVNVFPDGRLTLDSQTVTLEELTNRLAYARSQYQELGVVVRGDGSSPFQRVAEVLNACKKAGIAELAISVQANGRMR